MEEDRVKVIKLTPAHLSLINSRDNKNSGVKRFILGGDNLTVSLCERAYESFGREIDIFNEYGPTETVVGCMIYKYNAQKDKTVSVPIGHPADNVQIYILDENLNPVPVGGVGELYISGNGLARGYLNRKDLTEERFISNPFKSGSLMYRSGDLARFIDEETIEYIGRADNQVKVRGFRIELGEIEKAILKCQGVKDAVVIEESDGTKDLCAYLVGENKLKVDNVRTEISKTLTNYMIPTYIIKLEEMPLTGNGKVDKKALPDPKEYLVTSKVYEEPLTEVEKKLAGIWKEVLGVEKVGLNDSFFELGGHSLKVLSMAQKVKEAFNVAIPIKEIINSIPRQIRVLLNNYEEKNLGETISSINTARTLILAAGKFIPSRELNSELVLFYCSDGIFDNISKLNKYCKKIKSVKMKGNHFSIMIEPIVKDMAAQIDEIISKK